MDTLKLGRIGEASVIAHFVKNGYEVYAPLFGNTSIDLLVCRDGIIYRVEVKSTSYTIKSGAYEVSLRSVRSNKTVNMIKKWVSVIRG